MPSLVVLGAGGFLGRTLLAEPNLPPGVKAVARTLPNRSYDGARRLSWVAADLTSPGSLDSVIESGDTVVNLAYMPDAGEEANLRLIDSALESAVKKEAERFLHCSTAMVAGAVKAALVDENVACEPVTSYERAKLAVERRVLDAHRGSLEVRIIRPTAIVGPGGQNLLKLANSILCGNRLVNYGRASLFGRRQMHLVSARDVSAAILHLAELPGRLGGSVYIVASDLDPENNFASVERILAEALGRGARSVTPFPVPRQILPLILKAVGKSDADPARVYSSRKLADTGFRPVEPIQTAVRRFAESLRGDAC